MGAQMPLAIADATPFNERLKRFRDLHGLSKEELARELEVPTVTIDRWETASARPPLHVARKLELIGFGTVAPHETNVTTIPRLKRLSVKYGKDAAVAKLREEGTTKVGTPDNLITVLPAPFVRNGPPDQTDFYQRMLNLQVDTELPIPTLLRRFSMIEEVQRLSKTSQHLLEKPRAAAVTWNSNYGSHGWHRYVGRFPPHVIRALLNHFGADSTSIVCDPFAGSGTTAVECRLLGIPFVGIEICPLSSMITRTKAAFPTNPGLLLTLAQDFTAFYRAEWSNFVGKREITEIPPTEVIMRAGNCIPHFANVEKWFTSEALLGTSIAVEYAMSQEGFNREAILVALSAKMRSIGNVDVDVVRAEYRKAPRTNVDVAKLVTGQMARMAGDIAESIKSHHDTIGSESDIKVHQGSVLDMDLGEGSISHIITSPPYGTEAISYLRTHLLSYRSLVAHLHHDPYDTKEQTIGSEYLLDTDTDAGHQSQGRSQTCQNFFSRTATSSNEKQRQRRAAMMQFCDDMLAVGEKMSRWLQPNGRVAFVIGNKRLGDEVIPMDSIVTELFATCGLHVVDHIRHKLKTNNSNSQVPWQQRAIQEESIILFKKVGT